MGVDRTPRERILGMNLAWAVWDEAGASKDGDIIGLITERLRSGRADRRFVAAFTSPLGHGWLSQWSRDGVRVVRATTYQNTFLDPGYIQMLEREYPPGTKLHRQEMLGELVSLTGLIYGELFSQERHLVPIGYDPDLPYSLGWDPGKRAAGLVAFQRHGEQHVAVREWTPEGMFTDDLAGSSTRTWAS